MGSCFEQVCRDWASRYSTAQDFAGASEIGAYWTRTHDVEIDVVARTKRGYSAVGSCKWSTQADTHDLDRLIKSRDTVRGAGDARLWIFARGFHRALEKRATADDVHLISAGDLYA